MVCQAQKERLTFATCFLLGGAVQRSLGRGWSSSRSCIGQDQQAPVLQVLPVLCSTCGLSPVEVVDHHRCALRLAHTPGNHWGDYPVYNLSVGLPGERVDLAGWGEFWFCFLPVCPCGLCGGIHCWCAVSGQQ